MTTFYVAALARYLLVEADTEDQARESGRAALYHLYADLRQKLALDAVHLDAKPHAG